MSENFDPYLKWLGIRDTERPPNHYRLLGLELFEADPEVISAAADRQMAHVRTFQSGPNASFSPTVLSELAVARRCLLNEQSRADYDSGLRTASAKKPPRIRSFYEILGISPDADETEIRQGYRRAVQDHHPDHNPDDRRSAKRIRHLNAARATLLDPETRRKYDVKLRKRGMLPDQPGEGEPASEASTANSDETRFATDTDIPDLEPAPSAGFYSHSFQIESEPQPDYGQAASNPRQRTTSRRKRDSRAKVIITMIMVPLGGIAGVSVAILLLWVGFGMDPFGLFEADAKPVAQTPSDAPPETPPQTRPENRRPLDPPAATNEPKPEPKPEPKSEPKPEPRREPSNVQLVDVISPFSTSARTEKIKIPAGTTKIEIGIIRGGWTHETPAWKHAGKLGVLSVNDRVVINYVKRYRDHKGTTHTLFNAFDGTQPNTRLDETMQGVFDITAFAKPGEEMVIAYRHQQIDPKLGVRVRFHSEPEPTPANNTLGGSFAKLEFPTEPKIQPLAVGLPIHSDRDSVWSKVPVEMNGLQVTQWEVHQGRADVNVTSPGYVVMAVSPRWGGGGKDGQWQQELTTEQQLLDDGWRRLTTIEVGSDDPGNPSAWPVFVKQFKGGEKLKVRTEKYLAPRFFFPASKAPLGEETTNASSPPPANAPFDADTAKAHQQAWADHMGLPVEFENSIGLKMRLIPPGKFMMGDDQQHAVTLTRPFYLSIYEVTQKEYRTIQNDNPSQQVGSANPVERVTWDDSVVFCRKLSQLPAERKIDRVYRLPTEAEWEYACRAGTTTDYFFGDDPGAIGDFAWDRSNSDRKTHPVGEKKANRWGYHDMLGNVAEWCSDWQGDRPTGAVTDPTGPASGTARIIRGGSYASGIDGLKSAARPTKPLVIRERYTNRGFRVVLPIPDEYFMSPGNRTSNPVNENNTPRKDSGGMAQTPKKDEWVALFNGKTLDGWQGNHCWKIVNNTIVGECSKGNGTKLVSQKTYDDFELQFKFKLDYGNSGLFFRNYRTNDGTIVPFQAEIGFIPNLPMNKGRDFLTGCVNAELKVKHPEHFTADMRENLKKVVQDSINNNEWTKYEISAQGSRIRVRVNGILTVDFHNPKIVDRGKLRLQLHGGGTRVWFKDILVKER